MVFNFPLESCIATFSDQFPAADAFARAATACRPRRFAWKQVAVELSATGFIACALTGALLGSTPGTARADTKKAAPSTPVKSRAKTHPSAPQTCVAKSTNVASIVSRPRVSSLNALQPVAASSRRAGKSDNTNTNIRAKNAAPIEISSTDAVGVVEVLPAAPAPRDVIRLAAAPVAAQPESAPSQTVPAQTVSTETVPAQTVPAEPAATVPAPTVAPSNENEISEPLTATFDLNVPPQAGSTPKAKPTAATKEVAPTGTPSRLYAPSISYKGGVIIAQGTPENPARLESAGARITAQSMQLDTVGKTVSAQGTVRVERQVTAPRYSAFSIHGRNAKAENETITETLQGESFEYNYDTRQGQLGATRLRLANFNISAESLTINGQKYVAHNVVIRPGGLSDEELKIYGTPPFSLRAPTLTIDTSKPAQTGANVSDTAKDGNASVDFSGRTYVKGASLYYKNTRILPVPSAFLNRRFGQREQPAFQITPRISTNSSDGLLITTKLYFPVARENPERLSLAADIGLSTKIGFRGGVQLDSSTGIGDFTIAARINDIVETQLTNRIELDRLPEIQYSPPSLALFSLPGGRSAGLNFGFIAGEYRERFTDRSSEVDSSRLQAQVRFTTRLTRADGPYLDLFARASQYSVQPENLRTAGFEVGYSGPLTSRLAGQFSYSATSVSGSTPFRFDQIEIRKELRATFDILLSPRYIIPVDLRYDVDRRELRDTTFGILRNYKTFAYGVTYQSARKQVQLEVRQGF